MSVVLSAEMRSWANTIRRKASPRCEARSASIAASGPRVLPVATSRSEIRAPITMPARMWANVMTASLPISCSSPACSRSQPTAKFLRSSALSGMRSAMIAGSLSRALSRMSAILPSSVERLPASLRKKAMAPSTPKVSAATTIAEMSATATSFPRDSCRRISRSGGASAWTSS